MITYLSDIKASTKTKYILEGADQYLQSYWVKEAATHYGISLGDAKIEIDAEASSAKEIIPKLAEADLAIPQYLIVITNAEKLSKNDWKNFSTAFAKSPAVVFISFSKLYRSKTDESKKFIASLLRNAHVLDARKKNEYGVLEWIKKRSVGIPLRANQDRIIVETVGTDLGEIEFSLEKIRLAAKTDILSNSDLRELLSGGRGASTRQTVDLLLNGRFLDAMASLDVLKKTQSPRWFLKNLEEMLRKSILAKEVKSTGQDAQAYAIDFGNEQRFQKLWEIPISLKNIINLYTRLLPLFNSKFSTWEEVDRYVFGNLRSFC